MKPLEKKLKKDQLRKKGWRRALKGAPGGTGRRRGRKEFAADSFDEQEMNR